MKMNKNNYLFYGLILLFVSCKTLSIHSESQTKTIEPLVIGSIGSGKDFILQKAFNNTSYPAYTKPIKVSVLKTLFNKSTYKSFLKAKKSQSKDINIQYVDSIKEKPFYIKLQLADKVSLVNALNDKTNTDVKAYLSINPSANLITGLSIALNPDHLKKLEQAKSVFLVEENSKTYALQLHTNDNKIELIQFNIGIVFGYKTANCCWQENSKHQLNIVDLVSIYTDCPNRTYRSSNRAKKKINYFKI